MTEEPVSEFCDFCRLPRQAGTVTAAVQGHTYYFCSEHCRDAMAASDRVFTRYHGHRRFEPGLGAIDAALPEGCPRNAFVLVSAQTGTRDASLQAELAWRALQRGEPAVLVTFQEPPASLVERFVALDWNVLPYLERGQLCVVDCFTYRMAEQSFPEDHTSPWNRHLADAVDPATHTVRDPSDVAEVTNKLENAVEDCGLLETGVVVIDSLTELGALVQPVQAYDFVKDLRANLCKARFVPVFAGATVGSDLDEFPHDLAYVADGVIDLELNGEVVQDGFVKRLRVRKMEGVLSYPRWTAYEFTSGDGQVAFDPRSVAAGAGDGADGGGQGDGTGVAPQHPQGSGGGGEASSGGGTASGGARPEEPNGTPGEYSAAAGEAEDDGEDGD